MKKQTKAAKHLFGSVLKTLRKRRQMTLEDLSKRIGFSISYLSEIENAEKSPPERNIVLSMEKILNAKGKLLLSSFISNEHVTFVQSSMDLLNKKKLYEIYKSGK